MKRRQKVLYVIAALGSVLAHIILAGVAMLVMAFTADANLAPQPEPEPITLTITGLSEPEPTPTPTPEVKTPEELLAMAEPEFMKTNQAQESEEAPKNPDFEAERNTKVQSLANTEKNPASSLPSIEAKKRDFVHLAKEVYDPNRGPVNQSQPSKPAPATPPEPEEKPPEPTQPPEPTKPPEPTRPPEPTKPPIPSPEPKALPTPVPSSPPKPTAAPDPDKFAMLPKRPPAPQIAPTPKPTAKPRRPLRPEEARPPSTGHDTESDPGKLMGSISNKGQTAVNAAATPMGKYKAQVARLIEERWRYYMRGRADLMTIGSIKLKFYVTTEGKVQNLQLLGNTSNESFASYTVRSITEAKLPPIPPDVRSVLDRGRMEVEYSFVLISQ